MPDGFSWQSGYGAFSVSQSAMEFTSSRTATPISLVRSRSLSPRASRYEDSAKLSDEVTADRNGIGFAGMAFVRGSKPLAVSEAGAGPLLPTPFTVAAEHYPLSRRLFLYIPANPRNEWTQKFIDFALSELGGPSKLTATGFFARKYVESRLIKLEVFSWWTSGGEAAALDALFDNYRKKYPGVGVINATVAGGGGSAARPVLQSRLTVGNPPDTWQSHPRLGVAWSVRGAQLLRAGYRPIPK